MTISSGETQREAAALTESLTNDANMPAPEQSVPVHVVQAMREELRAEREKNEAFRNHFQMMQWQSQNQQKPQANPFEGADPEDSIKIRDAQRLMSDFETRTQAQLAEIKMATTTPDYKEVIQKYLPRAAQEDPDILEEIKRSPNPYKAAYMAAKASNAFMQDQRASYAPPPPKVDPDAERIARNSRTSGNLASVGNQANPTGQHPDFSRMSDAEFMQFKNQRLFRPKK